MNLTEAKQKARKKNNLDKMRAVYVSEMNRLEVAINTTSSDYLKKDYKKALKKMRKELQDYDRFRGTK